MDDDAIQQEQYAAAAQKEQQANGLLGLLEEPRDFLLEMRRKIKENEK